MAKNDEGDGDVGGGEPPVLEEAHVEHGVLAGELPEHERPEHRPRRTRAGRRPRASSSRSVGASMIAHSTATSPTTERPAPSGSRRGASASFEDGRRNQAPMRATVMTGTLTKKTEPHEKCWSRKPPSTGPRAPLAPAMAAHTPMARPRSLGSWKMLVSSDRVAGMINAAPMPIEARVKISSVAPLARPDRIEPDAEDDQADHQRALAAEAVADAAHGEQQAGEDERVAVDDPLQLAGGGVEVAQQVGDGDVEDRVVERDHQQARRTARPAPTSAVRGSSPRPSWSSSSVGSRPSTLSEARSFRNTIVS